MIPPGLHAYHGRLSRTALLMHVCTCMCRCRAVGVIKLLVIIISVNDCGAYAGNTPQVHAVPGDAAY